jgi:hypothetical protein
VKLIYDTNTNELAGPGSEGIFIEAPYAMADVPVGYEDYPMYFWIWNGVDAIVLKTGQALAEAKAKKAAKEAQPRQKARWRNKGKARVKKLKAGTATQTDQDQALEMALLYSMEM